MLEGITLHALSNGKQFLSASSMIPGPFSSATLALFGNVDSKGFLAIFSAADSTHSVSRLLERRLKQLEPDVTQGQEEAVENAAYNFHCSNN